MLIAPIPISVKRITQYVFANLFDLMSSPAPVCTETVFIAWTGCASRADDTGFFSGAIFNPANVEDLADAFDFLTCLSRNAGYATAAVTAGFDLFDDIIRVEALRLQRGRQVDASAHDMHVSGRVPLAYGLTAIESCVITIAKD